MATLYDYIEQLRNCSNGYDSRQIIVNAMEQINKFGGNASTLGGYDVSYFALKSDLTKLIY